MEAASIASIVRVAEKSVSFASAFSGIEIIVTATTQTRPIATTIAKDCQPIHFG
jgi:hypothetical protein